jgi:hypothetical protein
VYLVGVLKFYAQMASREGMSSYWCMWCTLHPSEWRTIQETPESVPEDDKDYGILTSTMNHLKK